MFVWCDFCDDDQQVFSGLRTYKTHLRVKHKDRKVQQFCEYLCFKCGVAFSGYRTLRGHLLSHQLEVPEVFCSQFLVVTNITKLTESAADAKQSKKTDAAPHQAPAKTRADLEANHKEPIDPTSGQPLPLTEANIVRYVVDCGLKDFDMLKSRGQEFTTRTCSLCPEDSRTRLRGANVLRQHLLSVHKRQCFVYMCFHCGRDFRSACVALFHFRFNHNAAITTDVIQKYLLVSNVDDVANAAVLTASGSDVDDENLSDILKSSDAKGFDFIYQQQTSSYECPHCSEQHGDLFDFRHHVASQHDRTYTVYRCFVCKKDLRLPESMVSHIKSKHSTRLTQEQVDKYLAVTNVLKLTSKPESTEDAPIVVDASADDAEDAHQSEPAEIDEDALIEILAECSDGGKYDVIRQSGDQLFRCKTRAHGDEFDFLEFKEHVTLDHKSVDCTRYQCFQCAHSCAEAEALAEHLKTEHKRVVTPALVTSHLCVTSFDEFVEEAGASESTSPAPSVDADNLSVKQEMVLGSVMQQVRESSAEDGGTSPSKEAASPSAVLVAADAEALQLPDPPNQQTDETSASAKKRKADTGSEEEADESRAKVAKTTDEAAGGDAESNQREDELLGVAENGSGEGVTKEGDTDDECLSQPSTCFQSLFVFARNLLISFFSVGR